MAANCSGIKIRLDIMCAYDRMVKEPSECTFSDNSQIQARLNATLRYVGPLNVAVHNIRENQHLPS